ncbi:MAG: ABC transporter substrate-binding protein [Dechloromonas sp.]|nr:ABC transporter substrate-binding protein [Dechloromonas sp.]
MQSLTLKVMVVLATAVPPSFTPGRDNVRDIAPPQAAVMASEAAPEELLGAAIRDLLQIARLHATGQEPANLPVGSFAAAVEARVRPLFDVDAMTKLALGRNWQLASAEQQMALVGEFGQLLVQTCVSALENAQNPVIEFNALPSLVSEGTLTVRSFVSQGGSKPRIIDYDMKRTPAGWRVVDMKMDGLRLAAIHRNAFDELVRENGVDGLLASLTAWNRRSSANSAAADSRQHLPVALILMHIFTQRGLIGGS